MRRVLKTVLGIVAVLLVMVLSLGAYAEVRWDRTFDAPYPELRASTDPEVIARGRYLAYGPAHCAYCHTKQEQMAAIDAGETPPLSGGYEWRLPFGVIRSPNLTPDAETGIGRYTDAELARMLRHGVKPDGRVALPFMESQNLADEDLVALISFLRSQPPVRHEVPPHEFNLVGRGVMATLIRPTGPTGTPPAHAPASAPTLERGAYLVNHVANCAGCHTQRSALDGSYKAPRLSGGGGMPLDDDPNTMLVPPNLTPDPKTGHIVRWTEEQFLARFRAGKIYTGTHMPWPLFGSMSDDDLRAIYRYLMSLEPVENETGPLMRKKGEAPAQVTASNRS